MEALQALAVVQEKLFEATDQIVEKGDLHPLSVSAIAELTVAMDKLNELYLGGENGCTSEGDADAGDGGADVRCGAVHSSEPV